MCTNIKWKALKKKMIAVEEFNSLSYTSEED